MFTKQDLDILFEAVEKWEQDDMTGEVIGMMLEKMARPEAREKIKIEREERERKRLATKKQRKERGVLLRAKLVALKDKIEVEAFNNSL